MRKTALIAFIVLAFRGGAWAGCENLEYAELKDMTKQQLNEGYCSNLRIADIALGQSSQSTDLSAFTEASQCLEQNKRIERLFHKRYKKAKLVCKGEFKAETEGAK